MTTTEQLKIVLIIKNVLVACSGFFNTILGSMGEITAIFIWCFVIYIVVRLFMRPLTGNAGSDRASKRNKEESTENE